MNYQRHYDNLIERAQNRTLNGYYELHHINPKCVIGYDDGKTVALTAREHFIAHLLLWKIHPNNKGLSFAVVMMGRRNNRNYGLLREIASKDNIAKTPEEREKRRERMKGNTLGKGHTEGKARPGELNGMYGRKQTEESKRSASEKKKGRVPWSKDGVCVMSRECPGEGWTRGNSKKKGKKAWNSGLTKDDPRVAKYVEKMTETRYGKK